MVKKLAFLDKKNDINKLILFTIIIISFYIFEKENKGSFISVETKLIAFSYFVLKLLLIFLGNLNFSSFNRELHDYCRMVVEIKNIFQLKMRFDEKF